MIAFSERLTLRQAFEQYHLPAIRRDVSEKTLIGYRNALNSWEEFGSPNLDVSEIRQSTLIAFRNAIEDAGRRRVTFDTKLRYIRAILGTLVEDEILDSLPPVGKKLKPVETESGPRPTPEEFERLIEATRVATWPTARVPAPQWWATLYAVAFITALRKGDLLSLRFSEHVGDDGIRIVAEKTRRSRKTIYVPFDPGGILRRNLDAMRGNVDQVFPVKMCNYFVREQKRISDAAGVPHDRATLQPIRRASLDAWCEADERAPGLIAGHDLKMPRVTRKHYVGEDRRERRIETILQEAVEQFPFPACLREDPGCKRQLSLF